MTAENAAEFQRARRGVMLSFAALGLGAMATATRLAELKTQIDSTDAVFGTALGLGAVGGFVGNIAAARIAHWVGTKRLTKLGGSLVVISSGAYGLVQSPFQIALVSMLSAMGYAMMSVAINAQGVEIEHHLGRSVMPSFHAAWSIGALTASITGNLVAGSTTPAQHLIANAAAAAVLMAVAAPMLLAHGVHAAPPEAMQAGKLPRAAWRSLTLIAIACTLGLAAEAGNGDWSAIHLHEDLNVPIGPNSLGMTVFFVAQIIGRLLGGRLNDRFGVERTVRTSATVGAVGYVVALWVSKSLMPNSSAALTVALVGVALVGLGVALLPAAFFSAAGRVPGAGAARGIAMVSIGLNVIMLAWKPFVAALAGGFGLTVALSVTGVALFVAGSMARVLRPQSAL